MYIMDIINMVAIILIGISVILNAINCSNRRDVINVALGILAMQCIVQNLKG